MKRKLWTFLISNYTRHVWCSSQSTRNSRIWSFLYTLAFFIFFDGFFWFFPFLRQHFQQFEKISTLVGGYGMLNAAANAKMDGFQIESDANKNRIIHIHKSKWNEDEMTVSACGTKKNTNKTYSYHLVLQWVFFAFHFVFVARSFVQFLLFYIFLCLVSFGLHFSASYLVLLVFILHLRLSLKFSYLLFSTINIMVVNFV